jgi:hypothetical protein
MRPPKLKEKPYIMQTVRPNNFMLSQETKTIIDVSIQETRFRAMNSLPETRPPHKRIRPEALRETETEGHRHRQRAQVLNDELGEYIDLHAKLFQDRGWEEFV